MIKPTELLWTTDDMAEHKAWSFEKNHEGRCVARNGVQGRELGQVSELVLAWEKDEKICEEVRLVVLSVGQKISSTRKWVRDDHMVVMLRVCVSVCHHLDFTFTASLAIFILIEYSKLRKGRNKKKMELTNEEAADIGGREEAIKRSWSNWSSNGADQKRNKAGSWKFQACSEL
jgi:hypothetical protein